MKGKAGKKKLPLEEKKSPLEQKKSPLEQKKSPLEPKKSSLEQKQGNKKSEQKKEVKKTTITAPPPSPLPLPHPPTKPMQGTTNSCYVNRVLSCDCPPTAVSQRKVLAELPVCPPAELNRRQLNKHNFFYLDDNTIKCNTKKQTELIFSNESSKKGRSSRSKSPKSANTRITGKLLEDLKEPLWEGQSMSSRSRSHSTGRNRREPSAKALSTGGIHKKQRSQSSDRPSDFRTYTARSLGAMVPQPRFNRGNRSGVNDPVKLYHYYQREWKYFEKQIPGVLTRADIRWQIRQKLLDPQ